MLDTGVASSDVAQGGNDQPGFCALVSRVYVERCDWVVHLAERSVPLIVRHQHDLYVGGIAFVCDAQEDVAACGRLTRREFVLRQQVCLETESAFKE
jgi:hypothetical protein